VKEILELLLPRSADNTIRGWKLPLYILIVVAVIGAVGSIAGMDLTVSGAGEVVFAFALWGSEQLIYVILQWIVIGRYRSLVPLMWIVQFLETLGRVMVGQIKPVTFAHTPPGAIQNDLYLVLAIVMVFVSLWSGMRAKRNVEAVG